jgi:ubiquinone biosynthesis protein UbiJ
MTVAPTTLHLLLAASFDRLLAHQPGIRARLLPHAGKKLRLNLPLLPIDLAINGEGSLLPALDAATPDTTIHLPPGLLAQLWLGDREALRAAPVEGDGGLATALLAAINAFDLALALEPALGGIAASRADQGLRAFFGWRQQAHRAAGLALAEWLAHETAMLANRPRVDAFIADVDTLRERLDRLDARLSRLDKVTA